MPAMTEFKVGDYVKLIRDFEEGSIDEQRIGRHYEIGRILVISKVWSPEEYRTGTDQRVHEGIVSLARRAGEGRFCAAHISHLELVEKPVPKDKAQFPPGTWVHLDGNHENYFYVTENQDDTDSETIRVRPSFGAIESERGSATASYRMEKATLKVKAADPIRLGSDIIVSTRKRGAPHRAKGTVLGKMPCAEGGDLYRVFIPGRGYTLLYASEMKLDPDSLVPDAHGHIHEWNLKWDGTYRECLCGEKNWQLACWTNTEWRDGAPEAQRESHPTLQAGRVRTRRWRDVMGASDGWTKEPHRTRSYGIIPAQILTTKISIVGAGAIGSFTALGLLKMGFKNLVLWDHDLVAVENIGTQIYGHNDIGKPKVKALKAWLEKAGPDNSDGRAFHIETEHRKWSLDDYFGWEREEDGVVVLAVDSMAARKQIWESIRRYNFDPDADCAVDWVLDARMGAEHLSLYTMNPGVEGIDPDGETYRKSLYTDENALKEPCTAAGTAYTAFAAATVVCKAVKDVLTGNPKYARILHWNIADNVQTVYHRQAPVEDLPAPALTGTFDHIRELVRQATAEEERAGARYRPILQPLLPGDQVFTPGGDLIYRPI
jgi:hypothetical protein